MVKIKIPVRFDGQVEILVSETIPPERREALARKMALSRIVATTNNPDSLEDEACLDYQDECSLSEEIAEKEWDSSKALGVAGSWYLKNGPAAC